MRISVLALAAVAAISAGGAALAAPFEVTSTSFKDGGPMALKYVGARKENANCIGANVSPELSWRNLPDGTKSLALVLIDPEGRLGLGVTHWVAYGISPTVRGFAEGETSKPTNKYVAGKGSYEGYTTYVGPCPPPNSAPHHYIFTVIATDLEPGALPAGLTKDELFAKLDGHAKAAASLVGTYAHP